MPNTRAYAASAASAPLAPFAFDRRAPGASDVEIEILYCGICHSDIHMVRQEWGGGGNFPMVPGHEIVGRVRSAGSAVTRFKPGDLAGVGCMVDSCRVCPSCRAGEENFCDRGATLTYNSPDPHGGVTYGGYSNRIVVDEAFALKISHPEHQLAGVAPLLCAGITTYSPLHHWNVGPGKRAAIVGLGGLGHMGVKLARALGADVTLITHSRHKAADAQRLGANHVIVSSDETNLQAAARSFDFILDTVSAPHDINAYISLLKRDGTLTLVGVPPEPLSVAAFPLILGRRSLSGSLIGGIRETQQMLDFCATRGIVSDVEVIPMHQVNQAFDRVVAGDVKYRFSIDMASLG